MTSAVVVLPAVRSTPCPIPRAGRARPGPSRAARMTEGLIMAKAKSLTFGPDNDFVFWPTPSEGRRGTIQLGQLLVGPTYSPPSFSFRFVRESDLSFYVAERVATTARKLTFAVAQLYA